MTKGDRAVFEFGPFRLDTTEAVLLRDGRPVPLTLKAYETLVALIRDNGHVVSKEDLLKAVWPDTFVEEGNLSHNIWTLRKALGETEHEKYIETVPRRGYRFTASVRVVPRPEPEAPSSETPVEASTGARLRWRALMLAGLLLLAVIAVLVSSKSRARTPPIAGEAPGAIRSLAVLPFKPVGSDVGEASLELGMADALIVRLSNIRQLDVRPTRAVAGYTRRDKSPVEIGRELKVDAVLDGTIQKDGDRVRVTVQLVSVNGGKPIWGDRFDEPWTDIFALQDRVSERAVRALTVQLSVEERQRLTKRYTDNAAAYELYLRGRYFWNKRTDESLLKGIRYFEQAIELDPGYALAYAGLAESYVLLPWYGGRPPREAFDKARAAALKALALDDQLAEAHTALAYVAERYDWDWAGAERSYKRALELHPNYSTAHQWYAEYLVQVARLDEAIAEMSRALQLDPLSLIINTELANVYLHARRYETAATQARTAQAIDPVFLPAHIALGRCYTLMGRYREADAEFRRAVAIDPDSGWAWSHVAHNLAKWGRTAEARAIVARLVDPSRGAPVAPDLLAMIYTGLGENDVALHWLRASCERRDTGIAWIKVHPDLDSLRGDPRFAGIVRCVGLTP